MTNPLLEETGLPAFSKIKTEHIKPAIESAIAEARAIIEKCLLEHSTYTWKNLIQPVDDVEDKLDRLKLLISHLDSVCSTDELHEAYESSMPLLSEYASWVGQHEGLYQAYKQISESQEMKTLEPAQQKVITNALRDFKLSGVALNKKEKKRYGEIQARCSQLYLKFSHNMLEATKEYTVLITDKNELEGLPESFMEAAAELAQSKDKKGWLFNLDWPSFSPVMMYANNEKLREKLYLAFFTRASDQGPDAGKWDSSDFIAEILRLRHELAGLFDFDNYCVYSLCTKMASSTERVIQFLDDLIAKSKVQSQQEQDELAAFAKDNFQKDSIQPWDLGYYSKKLKESRYGISDEELRPYFPENKVVQGLFTIVERIFGLTFKQRMEVDVWHESVTFYDVYDKAEQLRGSFYFDLYARDQKHIGAWMEECQRRRLNSDSTQQVPVAYLVCNLTKPVGDKPALFSHPEVETLFHEFGHGLHHILTQISAGGVSGINGVPQDAVELPSQFLENWCWQPESLELISGHYETNQSLPKEMLDKMLAAKNFQSATRLMYFVQKSLFDWEVHAQYDPAQGDNSQRVVDQIRAKMSTIKMAEYNRPLHRLGHIFCSDDYAAGFYSYFWSEVLSADAFSRFEEEGIFNADTGRDFLQNILEMGGSKDAMELFVAFRGREPQIDALLRHRGIQS